MELECPSGVGMSKWSWNVQVHPLILGAWEFQLDCFSLGKLSVCLSNGNYGYLLSEAQRLRDQYLIFCPTQLSLFWQAGHLYCAPFSIQSPEPALQKHLLCLEKGDFRFCSVHLSVYLCWPCYPGRLSIQSNYQLQQLLAVYYFSNSKTLQSTKLFICVCFIDPGPRNWNRFNVTMLSASEMLVRFLY
jgi:hypothetical protein